MEKSELIPGLHDLYHSCKFYWGNIDRNEAEVILKEKPNGSYLLKDRTKEDNEDTPESLGDNTEIIWYSDKEEEGIYHHTNHKFLFEFAFKFNSSIHYAIYTEELYKHQCKKTMDRCGPELNIQYMIRHGIDTTVRDHESFEFAAKCTIPVERRNVISLKELTKIGASWTVEGRVGGYDTIR